MLNFIYNFEISITYENGKKYNYNSNEQNSNEWFKIELITNQTMEKIEKKKGKYCSFKIKRKKFWKSNILIFNKFNKIYF